jgi:MYXO-CTERM domain-containing protein
MRTWPLVAALLAAFTGAATAGADTQHYLYDPAGHLIGVGYAGGTFLSYTYDAAGNLLRQHVCSGACLIAGVCYAAGAPDPTSGCLVCAPTTNVGAWSPAAANARCDGGACDADGGCIASTGAGGAMASSSSAGSTGAVSSGATSSGAGTGGSPGATSSGCKCRMSDADSRGQAGWAAAALVVGVGIRRARRRRAVGAS